MEGGGRWKEEGWSKGRNEEAFLLGGVKIESANTHEVLE
jgi:hypothetical protein